MLKIEQAMAKTIKSVAEKALVHNANSTTCAIFYQPKEPKMLEQFKKTSKYDK